MPSSTVKDDLRTVRALLASFPIDKRLSSRNGMRDLRDLLVKVDHVLHGAIVELSKLEMQEARDA